MRYNQGIVVMLLLGGLLGCASAPLPPKELIGARKSYARARAGAAAELAPADLRGALEALERAERAFAEGRELAEARDLAYLAERRAQLAEALGRTAAMERQRGAALQAYAEVQIARRKKRAPAIEPAEPRKPQEKQEKAPAQARAPERSQMILNTR
ncbi:DUF4398 domain-containing protein [Sorangium sp. So ce590]|uniref:DUF4398 domain-containing protein n=1 Tax=unclassified Sorangium TaxID=2621164 RepID=UPI003F60E887